MILESPIKAITFALFFLTCTASLAVASTPIAVEGGHTDSTLVETTDSLLAFSSPAPFRRVINDPSLDFSLRSVNPYPYGAARWDTNSMNIYQMDMTLFRDTLTYHVHDPENGHVFTFPVKNSWITSGFGYRRLFGSKFHYGIDFDLETGDEVMAAMDGTVRIARYNNGYGNFVIISHEGGLETLYGHLSELWVSEGTKIKSGEVIGLGGSTGRSTGSHLHFELRIFGEQVDPARIISPETLTLYSNTFQVDASWFDHLLGIKDVEYHIVQDGETLEQILENYELDPTDVANIDQINTDEPLVPGTRLVFTSHKH